MLVLRKLNFSAVSKNSFQDLEYEENVFFLLLCAYFFAYTNLMLISFSCIHNLSYIIQI